MDFLKKIIFIDKYLECYISLMDTIISFISSNIIGIFNNLLFSSSMIRVINLIALVLFGDMSLLFQKNLKIVDSMCIMDQK